MTEKIDKKYQVKCPGCEKIVHKHNELQVNGKAHCLYCYHGEEGPGHRKVVNVVKKKGSGIKEMYDEIKAKQNTSRKVYLRQDKTYSEYQDKKGHISLSRLFPILDKHLKLAEEHINEERDAIIRADEIQEEESYRLRKQISKLETEKKKLEDYIERLKKLHPFREELEKVKK